MHTLRSRNGCFGPDAPGGRPGKAEEQWVRGFFIALLLVLALQAQGAALQLGSVLSPGVPPPAGGGGDSYAPLLTPDGRYVLFASTANNLVLNNNQAPLALQFPSRLNVFLRDRTNQTTTLVSVNLAGTGGGDGDSLPSGISTNGRYALFESSADNLVPGDTNNAPDVFLRDLVTGTTLLVSVNTNGAPGNGASRGSTLTPDGRYVALASDASDLVVGDTNGIADVFVRDLQTRVTTLVSVGAQANGGPGAGGSESPDITPDGRYVAFYSAATNVVAGLTNSGDIYVRDLVAETTTWASSYARNARQAVTGSASAVSVSPVLSADGQFVAYQANPVPGVGSFSGGVVLRYRVLSGFTDVVHTNAAVRTGPPEDIRTLDMTPDGRFIVFIALTNGISGSNSCVYVWDAQTATTVLASGDPNGNVPTNSFCFWPSLEGSGRYVAFLSSASNLVTNSLVGDYHLYRRDLQASTTTLVGADTNGIGWGLNPDTVPEMTSDGGFVAFAALDANVVPNDSNHAYDAFIVDLAAGTNELISVCHPSLPTQSANGPSLFTAFSVSTDASVVAFASDADNLVSGDTNGCRDIFVHNLLAGTNCLVSVATNGAPGDDLSTDPAISGNGRYVAFTSSADNLVAGDTNDGSDVFVRDLQTGSTTLVSVNASGTGPGNGASYSPIISSDGRFVLFRSLAGNLAAGATGAVEKLLLRDLQMATTYGLAYYSSSQSPVTAMTPDGRFVAFWGTLFGSGSASVYIWDCLAATRVYTNAVGNLLNVAMSPDGTRLACQTNTALVVFDRSAGTFWTIGAAARTSHSGPRFGGDGRWLAYVGTATGTNQVYLYDLQYGTNFLVSHSYSSAAAANGPSDWPELSSNGRFVAYRSLAGDLVAGGSAGNGVPQLFLYDGWSNLTTLVSVNRFGTAAGDKRSLAPVFSPDSSTLLFASWASDLVPQDFNLSSDLFAYSLGSSGQIPVFTVTIAPGMGITRPGPWLSWPAIPGHTYQVQFKNSLSDPTWQWLGQDATIIGTQGWFNDRTAGDSSRYYRVVAY